MSNYQLGKVLFQTLEKKDVVSPIHKSGGKTMVSNYKPISILLVLSKVSEKWVAEQLKIHLNLGLHPMQFGFRTNQST